MFISAFCLAGLVFADRLMRANIAEHGGNDLLVGEYRCSRHYRGDPSAERPIIVERILLDLRVLEHGDEVDFSGFHFLLSVLWNGAIVPMWLRPEGCQPEISQTFEIFLELKNALQ